MNEGHCIREMGAGQQGGTSGSLTVERAEEMEREVAEVLMAILRDPHTRPPSGIARHPRKDGPR